ncbi:MAG: hypothetical protein A2494_04365 [Candidatus Lloydbacteria bacterium RIFOXYC12_FULL_46_25]|uniref:Uncharacterized protein n=1 Tax=Candidatus Lloydbacteria bacterium RIFOXYC12_FULL_46_25 TaxID=1798670 RepID=A0A1G2DTU8_9BACT|nr:MAG: hypothetical protein A2494_04365 [Candidatus Lloydbacteria bacterium RIFOXYC12_FULL_46_25]
MKTILLFLLCIALAVSLVILGLNWRKKVLRRRADNHARALEEMYLRDRREAEAMTATLNSPPNPERDEFYRNLGNC